MCESFDSTMLDGVLDKISVSLRSLDILVGNKSRSSTMTKKALILITAN
jgi:hypothetical protein